MQTKVQITYTNGTDEVRRFETLEDAIAFIQLCEELFRTPGMSDIESFEVLP